MSKTIKLTNKELEVLQDCMFSIEDSMERDTTEKPESEDAWSFIEEPRLSFTTVQIGHLKAIINKIGDQNS